VVADGGQAGPHGDRRRVAPGLLRGVLHGPHAPLEGLVGEEGVQDDVVEGPPTQRQGVGPEGGEQEGDVLVELRAEAEHGPRSRRTVMAEDDLAVPEPTHQPGEVLHLGGGDPGDAVHVLEGGDAPTDPEGEPAVGEAVHRRGVGGGDHRVTGVVVGCGCGDLDLTADRGGRAREGHRLLDVVPLGDERGPQAHGLAVPHLVEELGGRLGRPRQRVEAQLGHALSHRLILSGGRSAAGKYRGRPADREGCTSPRLARPAARPRGPGLRGRGLLLLSPLCSMPASGAWPTSPATASG